MASTAYVTDPLKIDRSAPPDFKAFAGRLTSALSGLSPEDQIDA
jgi:hypothetical protein